jgi:hypothetical protein
LERAGLALPERRSLCLCARFFGDASRASAPVPSNRPRCWQLIQECRHSAARPKRFRDPPHRETWSRFAAICDTSHTEMRKVSCPAPAPPQSWRNTAPMNQLLVGCSDLPSPIFFLCSRPMQVERSSLPSKKLFVPGEINQNVPSTARVAAGAVGFLSLIQVVDGPGRHKRAIRAAGRAAQRIARAFVNGRPCAACRSRQAARLIQLAASNLLPNSRNEAGSSRRIHSAPWPEIRLLLSGTHPSWTCEHHLQTHTLANA